VHEFKILITSSRPGAWLPADNRVHREWLGRTIDHIDKHGEKELIPVLREFEEMIESNPRIYMYFTEMWDEIPSKPPYQNDPTGKSQIRDYQHMLQVLNHVFGSAPEWYVPPRRVLRLEQRLSGLCQLGRMRLQA
jgi:phosphatidylserine decarboxylase